MMNSPSDFKTEVNQINVPEEKLNHAIDIAIKKGRRKRLHVGKKIAYTSCAAVLLFVLLLSSAFVSPAIAKVVSKIPYLSLIFESKPVVVIIMENLEEKGYKNIGIGIRYKPKKNIQITVEGSAKYYNEVKEDISKIAKDVLNSKGYDAYSITVIRGQERKDYVLNEQEQAEKQLLESKITKKLKDLNFKFNSVQTDPTENTTFINIEGSKAYYNDVKNDVKTLAKEVAEVNKYTGYNIKVTKVTVKVRKDDKGSEITPVIAEGLISKKEYKVTEVGYKFNPLTFIISTSVKSSDPKAKELGVKIEKTIQDFLRSEGMKAILKNEPYKINVISKDKRKLN